MQVKLMFNFLFFWGFFTFQRGTKPGAQKNPWRHRRKPTLKLSYADKHISVGDYIGQKLGIGRNKL